MNADNRQDAAPTCAACRQIHLNEAARLARETALHARAILRNLPDTDEGKNMARMLVGLSNEAWAALDAATQAGAVIPEWQKHQEAQEQRDAGSLAALSVLADPETEGLLALMEQAQEIAERMDKRRGRVLPDSITLQPGESRGTDLAEAVSMIAQRLRIEAFGPMGRD